MKQTASIGANPYTVIVNWNLKNDTIECLDSLLAAGLGIDKIILVDNGSTDGSVDAFKLRYEDRLHVLANALNIGFAAGCNQGMQMALDQGADWILILNNDAIVKPDFFSNISQAMTVYPQYDILGPVIYYASDPERIWFLGHRLIPGTLLTRGLYSNLVRPHYLPETIPVDFLNGCAMLIRRDVLLKVGFFDPSFVMYGEEVDLCWRAHLAGFQMACITGASVWHKVSLSANRARSQTRYLRVRNQMRFYKKYAHPFQLPIMFLISIVKLLTLIIQDVVNDQNDMISRQIKGWIDGWFRQSNL